MLQDNPQFSVDQQNYLYINGVKTCRVLPGNVLEFYDRNRERRRGSSSPRVGLLEFVKAVAELPKNGG
jgi:hypothetical protein